MTLGGIGMDGMNDGIILFNVTSHRQQAMDISPSSTP